MELTPADTISVIARRAADAEVESALDANSRERESLGDFGGNQSLVREAD